MRTMPRALFTGVILGVTMVASATAGPTLAPLGTGSPYYEAAVRGDPAAQARLGAQYKGSDAQAAFQWLWRAAQQGHGGAQLELADMFATGRTVPKHLVTAYQWAHLAQTHADDPDTTAKADQLIGRLARQLSDAEIRDALRRAADWQPRREVQPQSRVSPTTGTAGKSIGPVLAATDSKPVITVLAPDSQAPAATTSDAPPASAAPAPAPATKARQSPRMRASPKQVKASASLRAYLRARLARFAHR